MPTIKPAIKDINTIIDNKMKKVLTKIEQLDMKLADTSLTNSAASIGLCTILKEILLDKKIITIDEANQYFSPENIDNHVQNIIQYLATANINKQNISATPPTNIDLTKEEQ